MTREETKKILMNIECSYPNWKPSGDLGFMVDIWTDDLKDYTYQQVYMSLKAFKATDISGFAPNIGQLINGIHNFNEYNSISEQDAWAQVYKAICCGTTKSEECFNQFSEEIQKAVGSPNQLYAMATNPNFNESVERALFLKAYRRVIEQKREIARLPGEIKAILELEEHKITGLLEED